MPTARARDSRTATRRRPARLPPAPSARLRPRGPTRAARPCSSAAGDATTRALARRAASPRPPRLSGRWSRPESAA
eukprot:6746505-Prymnesium_polylepis.2